MLVVSRREGEGIRIGSDVVVKVVSIATGQVRLAIDAPSEVVIHRDEVYERIAAANREAASMDELPTLPAVPKRRKDDR